MKKTLKRILALALVLCSVLSYAAPTAQAGIFDDLKDYIGGYGGGSSSSSTTTDVIYDFVQTSNYNKIPDDPSGKGNPFTYTLLGGDYLASCKVTKSIPERYASGDLNWTYEAASAGACGTTTELEHVPLTSGNRYAEGGYRSTMGQGQWLAIRIKSPGAGAYTVKMTYRKLEGAPTVAMYIMEAEGTAITDLNTTEGHDTVLTRREAIHAAMDPDNRVGKVDQNVGTTGTDYTNFIGNYTFEADKEYIVVFENYEVAAIAGNYWSLHKLVMTPGETAGTETKGEDAVSSILVQENVVPAADGGYMTAIATVNGHDYYFQPLEGGKMAIFDLDKHVAGEESLVKTVTTGLYYPTHATVTNDGRVIVGGDGKKMFIFDTKTMTGVNTPDFRSFAGLKNEGHNQGSHYGSDGYLYFGTLYGGHAVQYDIEKKTYVDLGDLVTASVREMAGITAHPEEETGGVRATYYHDGYLYAKADSDNYTLLVKVDVAQRKPVAAINITDQLHGSSVPHGVTVLGDKYVIAGGNSGSGMVLVDIDTFTLVKYDDVVNKGLFSSKSTAAQELWEHGMGGHASEVINGKQYFYSNNGGLYSYDVATGKMAKEHSNFRALRTGQKASVTLDINKDGVEETYVLSYASSGLRLFNVDTKKTTQVTGLEIDMSAVGGSSINIGTDYDNVLYIGAWNNWNCAAFDTETETIISRYVTGGQTDSQTHYVDENGKFHLISGNYSACVVYEIDPLNKTGYNGDADTNIIKPLISKMKSYDQKRIHTVAAGDGYVFAGTIPTSYVNGGGVGTYNYATGKETFLHFKEKATAGEPTVPAEFSELWDLSVKGIVYYDGRLYGATTRGGGSGSGMVAGTSAQIFVMDYVNNKIEATLDLRDYLQNLPGTDANGDKKISRDEMSAINYVGGISIDDQGRFWGLCSDVLFCFTYDKSTKTFTVQEVLMLVTDNNPAKLEYQSSGGVGSHNREVLFDKEHSCVYTSFYYAEMQEVVIADWNASVGNIQVTKNTQILTNSPETYALGADNNLYYAEGTSLYMKPLHITESDWTEAKAVDAQIEALGDITADKMDDVAAVKEAYNNLSLRDKALVQEYRALLEVEAQVLELQIEEEIANVTADSAEKLGQLLLQYDDLASGQKRYVQNYGDLQLAYETSLDLANAAAEVQELINKLPDVAALTDEEAVVAARNAYTALSDSLKSRVNTDKLVAAEARIAELKGANAVQVQINSLPDNVTTNDADTVAAARAAYEALSDEMKATIDITRLENAEAQLADIAAAAEVQAKIDALPEEITLENKKTVTNVRKAYDALSDYAKTLVDTTRLENAEAVLAELAKAEAVQTQINALPEQIAITDMHTVAAARAAYDALSAELQALVDTAKLVAAEAALDELEATAIPTKQVYDIEIYKNPAFYTDCTKYAYNEESGRIPANMPASKTYNSTYSTIAKWFYGSYPASINWGIELTQGSETAYTFRGAEDQGMRMTSMLSVGQYGSLRIFVPAAGVYDIGITAGQVGFDANVYIIPANTVYANERTSASAITAAMVAENLAIDNLSLADNAAAENAGQWNFPAAGDYIVIFQATAANSKGHSLRNITLTPVINEETAVAVVGDTYFLSLDEAVAYQVETGAEYVSLNKDAQVSDLILAEGAVLDLNGKTLTVDSVLSYASSGIIDNSEKDTGVLKILDAEGNMLDTGNSQLPIYDAVAEGYRFFEFSVKAVTVTGKEDPKYWFKVSAENFDEIYKLIQAGSALNITAKMTWMGGKADAVAGADFLNTWAELYAAGKDYYITVSAVNTEGLEDFSMTPAVAANGVEICGSGM